MALMIYRALWVAPFLEKTVALFTDKNQRKWLHSLRKGWLYCLRKTGKSGSIVGEATLKAKGHPVGATGVAQAVEMWEQFRGEAGTRQVKDATIGITHNMGGIGTIVLVNVYGNEPR